MTGVVQQLVQWGWLLGQMQFKYWVPQPRLFIFGLKILPFDFSKKTTAEFDLGFRSIYLILVFNYCFTLFLIFNNYTLVGLACSSLFNTFKLQPRVVETRLQSHESMVVNPATSDNIDSTNQKNVLTQKLSYNSCCCCYYQRFYTQTRLTDQFPLYLPIRLVCMQL